MWRARTVGDWPDVNGFMLQIEQCEERKNQQHTVIWLTVDNDRAFRGALQHARDTTLMVFLMTPNRKLLPHRTSMHIMNMTWRTSVIDLFLQIMGIVPQDFDHSFIYIAHKFRPTAEALDRCSYLMTLCSNGTLSVGLVPPQEFPVDEATITAQMTEYCSSRFGNDMAQGEHENELHILETGRTLEPMTAEVKTDREKVEERKRQIKAMDKQAAAEVEQEMDH